MVMVPTGLSAGWDTLTGNVIKPTARFGFLGTDLGYFFTGGKGQWVGAIFGDTFDATDPDSAKGRGWRSPVILRTSSFNGLGLGGPKWDNAVGGGRAKEVWPYRRIGNGAPRPGSFDAFTIIPNDVIQLPNGIYMGNGFRVRQWVTSGDQDMCTTYGNAWFWSNEQHAENWQECRHANNLGRLYQWENSGWERFFQNTSMVMVPGDEHVYVFGTPEGRKKGREAGIYLRRAHWTRLTDDKAWEFWAHTGGRWQWQIHVPPTPIITPKAGWPIGEIDAQVIGGKVVLSYVSPLGAVCQIADRPDTLWSREYLMVPHTLLPSMYAPSLHPKSTLSNAFLHLSSWPHAPNPAHKADPSQSVSISSGYGVYGFRGPLKILA
ncbi:DUF4185 domain-containing protein [Corynebacterium sp. zg331]|nr:DUF4185 domain-containing protein [Corynebacterium sp. zg331]